MEKSRIEQELDELLAESLEAASSRVAALPSLRDDDALALYGAGTLGRVVLKNLRDAGVEPVAFADDTAEKQGQTLDGLRVTTPEKVVGDFGERAIFVVTILNPALRFLEAKKRLETLTGARVISFLDLAWQHPEAFLPYYQFELPQNVLTKVTDIRRAFHLWEDDESRRQFVAHLRFRLYRDYAALPKNSRDNYFPSGVLPRLPRETTFVDCGAYDGDTIQCFLEHQQGRFHEIFAFEPDDMNCQKLRDYVSTLGAKAAGRIHIYNAGVGSHPTKMKFNPLGNTSAAFSDSGSVEVDVVPIQEIVDVDDAAAVYVKFDVEGAEWDALKGTEELIRRAKPVLAVSIYHQPDDLWQLPLYLKSLNPRYKFFLRTQGEDGMDAICYAVPGRES